MTAICSATKKDGTRCTLPAQRQKDRCWAHSPENAAQRRRIASRGGKGKASSVTKELHAKLVELTVAVEDGSLVPYRGAVCAQLINTRIRLIELEKKIAEQQEGEERLARIEALERGRGGRSIWGA